MDITDLNNGIDELARNYQEMDESEKEKLLNETEKIHEIHKNKDDKNE